MKKTHVVMLTIVTMGLTLVGCDKSTKQDASSPEIAGVEGRRKTMDKRKPSANDVRAILAGKVDTAYSPKYAIQNIEMLDEEHAQVALTFPAEIGLRPVFAKLQWATGKWELLNFSYSEEHDSGLTPIGSGK